MNTTEITPQDLHAADGLIPKDTPFVMLNLLRYREQADYSNYPEMTPCSGRDAYHQNYVPAFNKIAEAMPGIQLLWVGTALARLVGPPDEDWDEVALVRYPSFAAFRALVESSEYKTQASYHRLAALENWRLIAASQTLPAPD